MFAPYIKDAARAMADTMAEAPVPMYGSGRRLPERHAVIAILKEIRRLMFPAYFGGPHDLGSLGLCRPAFRAH